MPLSGPVQPGFYSGLGIIEAHYVCSGNFFVLSILCTSSQFINHFCLPVCI